MKIKEIPISETGLFPKIVNDYLNGDHFLRQFYQYEPSIDSFVETIKNRNFPKSTREILVSALKAQYKKIGLLDDSSENAIQSLLSEKTFTVTTGHQLCIYTGPLYFIYKIFSTIALAKKLQSTYPEYNFIPVFWLASEDHDFEEISHITLFDNTIKWQMDSENMPVGCLPTEGLNLLSDELKQLFNNSTQLPQLLTVFEEVYRTSGNLSEATRRIVHELFNEYGLLMIEPDDSSLKKILISVMEEDICNHTPYSIISKTNLDLQKEYKPQVNGREINFFYLSEKGRNLIRKENEDWTVTNTDTRFTKDQLIAEIRGFPQRFSPNVILRPVYQELILPNLAYVGGPAEVAYWLQLKGIFESLRVPFPVVILRDSFFIIDPPVSKKLEKSGLSDLDFFNNTDELKKIFFLKSMGFSLEPWIKEVELSFQKTIDQVMRMDNQMGSKLLKMKLDFENQISKLDKELMQKMNEKADADLQKVMSVKECLFPKGTPQERIYNVLQFFRKKSELDSLLLYSGNPSMIKLIYR